MPREPYKVSKGCKAPLKPAKGCDCKQCQFRLHCTFKAAFAEAEFRHLLHEILKWHEHTEEAVRQSRACNVEKAAWALGDWLKKHGCEWEELT